jgi:hypothetical protein
MFIRASNGDEQTQDVPISEGGVGLTPIANPQGFYLLAFVSECYLTLLVAITGCATMEKKRLVDSIGVFVEILFLGFVSLPIS